MTDIDDITPKRNKPHKMSWEQTSNKKWEKEKDQRQKAARKAGREIKRGNS